ncbi:hypothetical protein NG895_14260 [Aeoliella sp. ICT_H6.2]|uniref:HipA-like protein n=1 Tax=Aeoliella straminimaris TaxID=2954799 RepID=A0A9X2JGI3_9BACT|nr:hypothetical protein [Aeoliella straminimaris]MCO6045070.1 hypothetical protein [Aeoliella straminimaris]
MGEYPTTRVDRSRRDQLESLGSKPKFWFRDGQKRLLFKADDRGTGEDWAEVIACELCKLIGMPHVHYDLATEYDGEKPVLPGVICENMAPPPRSLVLGNQMLLSLDPSYPSEQRWKVSQHTIKAVESALSHLQPVDDSWAVNQPLEVESALDSFCGYVLLDAWIANQDRHHENWGAIVGPLYRLAPTFDHGAALARNILDDERRERLSTKDRNRTIASFVKRGRSAFYSSGADKKPLSTIDAARSFAALAPRAAQAWVHRMLAVSQEELWNIIARVPKSRLSEIGQEFTLGLLIENQKRLEGALNP